MVKNQMSNFDTKTMRITTNDCRTCIYSKFLYFDTTEKPKYDCKFKAYCKTPNFKKYKYDRDDIQK